MSDYLLNVKSPSGNWVMASLPIDSLCEVRTVLAARYPETAVGYGDEILQGLRAAGFTITIVDNR